MITVFKIIKLAILLLAFLSSAGTATNAQNLVGIYTHTSSKISAIELSVIPTIYLKRISMWSGIIDGLDPLCVDMSELDETREIRSIRPLGNRIGSLGRISTGLFLKRYSLCAIVLILLSAIFYIIHRTRINSAKLKNQLHIDHIELSKQKELDRIKSNYFIDISHEFRTSLTLILGSIDKWLLHSKDQGLINDLHVMKKIGFRMLRLLNQLLDLSTLDAFQAKLIICRENIVELLKELTFSFTPLAELRQINLSFISTHDLIPVYFDRDKIEQIFSNLILNAFKYTPQNGKITVSIIADRPYCDKDTSQKFIEITVRDSGKGIAQEQIDKIFNRFYRGENKESSAMEGTGIGLSLVKEYTELHHGKIFVKSRIDYGTMFTVLLPLGRNHFAADINKTHSQSESFAQREKHFVIPEDVSEGRNSEIERGQTATHQSKDKPHVLIVEDNSDVRSYIRKSLDPYYRISEASDGLEGYEVALKIGPDLIISDIMMPKMDGFELCRKIKTDQLTSHIPIILLTAKLTPESKIEGLENGADEYLTKPFDRTELLVRIKNLIHQRRLLNERFRQEIIVKPGEITVTPVDKLFLERVIAIVEQNIGDPDFDIHKLADKVGMSRMNLHRKLRALTGQSPGHFICSLRLKRAVQLIEQNSGNMTEVAFQVGFNSSSYFTRCFRLEFGMAPSEYTKNENSPGCTVVK